MRGEEKELHMVAKARDLLTLIGTHQHPAMQRVPDGLVENAEVGVGREKGVVLTDGIDREKGRVCQDHQPQQEEGRPGRAGAKALAAGLHRAISFHWPHHPGP